MGGAETRPATGAPPATLVWAVRLLWGQGALVLALAVWTGVLAAVGEPEVRGAAVGEAVLLVVASGLLGGLGYALGRRQRWARGPAIVLELMLLPIGWAMLAAGLVLVAVPVLALGLAGAGLLLAPSTRIALGIGPTHQ